MEFFEKVNPESDDHGVDLLILNEYSNYISTLSLDQSKKDTIRKVVENLKFIKVNPKFIFNAVDCRIKNNEHKNKFYTYRRRGMQWILSKQDEKKGLLRDFNNTSLHLNSYTEPQQAVDQLNYLVTSFEQAILEMKKRERLLEFSQKIEDSEVGYPIVKQKQCNS